MNEKLNFIKHFLQRKKRLSPKQKVFVRVGAFNLFVWALLTVYMLPIGFMIVTSFMPTQQLTDYRAPLYPATIARYEYQGKEYQLYNVPTANGVKQWALVEPHRTQSKFIDPQHPEAGPIEWEGNWRALAGVYKFSPAWDNFLVLVKELPFPQMLGISLLIALVSGMGMLVSSMVVAYGFSRFPLPGGNLLFYVLIATILIPDKVTYIPTYFLYVNALDWRGTLYPLILPFFFGNAVYIFLLRQNFRSIPIDVEEAAMLDGAGPIRRLFAIVLPQAWPAVITVSILHFFYIWNETRQASLYLSTNPLLRPVSFGIQEYQSFVPIQNLIGASTLVVMIVPVILLFLSQRFFMQNMIFTGAEKE
jgi:multiple sugar transport system permease protein